jgi:site-specific DNA recombinase
MLEFGQKHHELKDAVIYARVSSKAQVKQGMGVESQTTYCRQYAGWKGYTVQHVFKDVITGGRSDREGIKAMLKFLRRNRSKRFVVIVDDISRLARDIRVHLDLRDAIEKCGAVMESPTTVFGTDSDSRFFENMQALNAQHHREKNAEQTKKRQQARLMGGYWPFPAPIGYKHERKPGHGKVMVPQEPLASIIREALEGLALGRFQTQAEVARFLETRPDFPKNRFGKVTQEAANRILTRVLYAGYIEVPKWNVPLQPGKHEGLVSFETFQKVQERLAGNSKVPVRKDVSEDFPLRGFVLCNDCSRPLTACWSKSKTGKKHPYYMCYFKGCESHRKSIPRDRLEGEFETLLQSIQPSQTMFDLVRDMFKRAWGMQSEREKTFKASIKRQLAEIEKKTNIFLDRIVTSSNATVIETYEKQITDLEKEKLVMEERLAKSTKTKRPFDKMFELALSFLSNPQHLWLSGGITNKKIVLKLTFEDKLTYCRNGGLRTPEISRVFAAFQGFFSDENQMAEDRRFELLTF